jgi:hypothetical protein
MTICEQYNDSFEKLKREAMTWLLNYLEACDLIDYL